MVVAHHCVPAVVIRKTKPPIYCNMNIAQPTAQCLLSNIDCVIMDIALPTNQPQMGLPQSKGPAKIYITTTVSYLQEYHFSSAALCSHFLCSLCFILTRVELQQTAPTDSRVAQSPADGESIPQRVAWGEGRLLVPKIQPAEPHPVMSKCRYGRCEQRRRDGRNDPEGGSRGRWSVADRYGHRRSPTTGHRVRRNKTPEPNFAPPPVEPGKSPKQKKEKVKRSLSSPGKIQEPGHKRISSSDEDEEASKPRKLSKTKSESTKSKLEASKRWSGVSLTSTDVSNEEVKPIKPKTPPPKPSLRTRSKSRGREEKEEKNAEDRNSSWWKSWPSWTQRIRGKSLERDPGVEDHKPVPPRRNRSLERPPVIKEKEKRAAAKKEKEEAPVAKKRSKSKSRTTSDEERVVIEERRRSLDESSDEFWKASDGARRRHVEEKVDKREEFPKDLDTPVDEDNSSKQLVLVEALVERKERDSDREEEQVKEEPKEKVSVRQAIQEIRSEWKNFLRDHPGEIKRIRSATNSCIVNFVILMIYCGTGALIFRFTEGAFESFYKCGVKRVKRDFVDALWTSSHHLREEDWKSLARRKLMEFEEQLHTAYEAGMTSYSGLKAWSFLNAVIYCITVVTTIGKIYSVHIYTKQNQ
ncbi:hypothetical protein J6590_054794 [Homalodisca vitripennis]|nr:hypothetical protein J6590_054794 [Homalodisca vitripennis]